MGKVDYFSITLQKPSPIYFAGETIVGTVNLRVHERFKINSVKMVINGSCNVRWSESHGSGKNRRTVTYSAHETYLSFKSLLVTKQPHEDELYLEPGDMTFPFNIVLPPNIPTSYEHQYGKVRYSIQATIDIPWAFDKHTIRSFTVISHYDLNPFPGLKQSQGATAEKHVGCLCCKAGTISGFFATPKTGYVPGEKIQFGAKIQNNSSRDVKEMKIDIIEQIKFHSTRKTKTCLRHVAAVKFDRKISPNDTYEWTSKESQLVVPPVPSSSNGTCRLIEISYYLNLNFDASGISVSTDLKIPIVIGTIPFHTEQAAMTNETNPYSFQISIFDSDKDGNFEEEIKGEIVESDGGNFKPFYPYYNNMPSLPYDTNNIKY